jgi:hypothetical protein
MKGIFNIRLFMLLGLLFAVYLFACDFDLPLRNIGKKAESIAYVDSVKNLQLFDLYTYNQIYYHYVFDNEKFVDSITSNRVKGNVNSGDSLVILISRMNPGQHTVKSVQGIKQDQVQYMGW